MVVMTFAFTNANAQIFLGKGDVQTVLGLNNAQMNTIVANDGLVFTYDAVETYAVTIEWTNETGGKNSKTIYHAVTLHRDVTMTLAVDYTARKNKSDYQVTGFWLTFGTATTDGATPQVGDLGSLYINAGGNNLGNDAIVTDVQFEGSFGGLFVNGKLIPTFVL